MSHYKIIFAGPVGAGFAVQQRRVFDGLEEFVHGVHLLDLGRGARIQLDVVERDAELLAGLALQRVELRGDGVAERDWAGAQLGVVLGPGAFGRLGPVRRHTNLLVSDTGSRASHHRSAVDAQDLPGDETGLIRTQEPDRGSDVLGCGLIGHPPIPSP